MKIHSIPLVCLAAGLTTACATSVVKTQTGAKNPGVIYHLPMRLAKLNATRKAAPADLGAAIAKAEDDKKKAEEAITSAVPKINDLIALIDQASKATTPNQQAVTKLKSELEDVRKAMADNVVKAQNLESQIKALKELQALQAKNTGGKTFLYDLKVVLEDPIPDTSTSYVATLNKGLFRDDKLTIETTAAGLLTSGNATASGREGDVLVELAGAAGAFTFGGGTGAGVSFQGVREPESYIASILQGFEAKNGNRYQKCLSQITDDGPNDAVELRFDPSNDTAVVSANCALWRNGFPFAVVVSDLQNQSYEDTGIAALTVAQPAAANDATTTSTVAAPGPVEAAAKSIEAAAEKVDGAAKRIEAAAEKIDGARKRRKTVAEKVEATAETAEQAGGPGNSDNLALGLTYRRPAPRFITINQLKKSEGKLVQYPLQSALMLLPQAGERGLVPIKGRAFTKTVNDVTFENGMLTKWDTSRVPRSRSCVFR